MWQQAIRYNLEESRRGSEFVSVHIPALFAVAQSLDIQVTRTWILVDSQMYSAEECRLASSEIPYFLKRMHGKQVGMGTAPWKKIFKIPTGLFNEETLEKLDNKTKEMNLHDFPF